jgi:hypothetical protein
VLHLCASMLVYACSAKDLDIQALQLDVRYVGCLWAHLSWDVHRSISVDMPRLINRRNNSTRDIPRFADPLLHFRSCRATRFGATFPCKYIEITFVSVLCCFAGAFGKHYLMNDVCCFNLAHLCALHPRSMSASRSIFAQLSRAACSIRLSTFIIRARLSLYLSKCPAEIA